MKFIADLHIHSKYSRATSRSLTPEFLSLWGQKKGIKVIGTGDFTHPEWFLELKEKLQETENGLFSLKPEYEKEIEGEVHAGCASKSLFILSGEISCIYKKNDKTRKVHNLILMPDFESAEKFNTALDKIGNVKSDGRPILGLDSKILLEMMLEASDRGFFIPAHVWTPWFSLFGSKSGFDDIEECFEDLTPYIHALETGLSSDPPMNRLLSALDKYLLVSNSDAHSPSKLGREANIFNTGTDYDSMIQAMSSKKGFEGTIEFFPEEGKYHMDGHRKCNAMLHPNETIKNNGICPGCGKPVTVGVFHRVAELADRETPVLQKDFYSLIPLAEILSEILGTGPNTKTVNTAYEKLLSELGPELDILLNMDLADIEEAGGVLLSKAISRMRDGEVIKQEGYDGEYGVIRLFRDSEKHELIGQKRLFKAAESKTGKKPKPNVKKTAKAKKKDLKTGNQASFIDPIVDPLNEKQREAVLHNETNLIINAGPGTGKTLTLTHKIAREIHNGITPDQVLALTFTNKAAREMMERVNTLLPGVSEKGISISTFHGFCLKVLREEGDKIDIPPDFSICSEGDSRLIIDDAANEMRAARQAVSRFKKSVSDLKLLFAVGKEPGEEFTDVLPLFERYRQSLKNLNMLDFNDLEAETLRLFSGHPDISAKYAEKYRRIFVDEYQDTNRIQSLILRHLIKDGTNLICAIGDPDQAIYGFRGADIDNFYKFTQDFPGAREISLSINYRSTDNILEAAAGIVKKENPLEGTSGKGDFIRISECATPASEAEMVVEQIERMLGGTSYFSLDSGRVASHEDGDENTGFEDIAVLFRTNSQGDAFEEALSRAGIPFVRSGERSLTGQYPVDVIMRYLQTRFFPDNRFYADKYRELLVKYNIEADITREEFSTGTGITQLIDDIIAGHNFDLSTDDSVRVVTRLKEAAAERTSGAASITDLLSLERGIDNTVLKGDRVALMSIHAAKGLEWPVVFITGCEDKIIPLKIFGDSDDLEEKRLFYVGITRARNRLILSHTKNRKINNRSLDMNVSPFVGLIPDTNIQSLERKQWKPKKKEKQLSLF